MTQNNEKGSEKDTSDQRLGYLAECYVILELAKRGLCAHRMHKDTYYDYDMILSNGLRIEVKSSSILTVKDHRRKGYKRKIWAFANYERGKLGEMIGGRRRDCDFYVLVCFGEKKEPVKYYVVPSVVIGNRQTITIPCEYKQVVDASLIDYENKWEFIDER